MPNIMGKKRKKDRQNKFLPSAVVTNDETTVKETHVNHCVAIDKGLSTVGATRIVREQCY